MIGGQRQLGWTAGHGAARGEGAAVARAPEGVTGDLDHAAQVGADERVHGALAIEVLDGRGLTVHGHAGQLAGREATQRADVDRLADRPREHGRRLQEAEHRIQDPGAEDRGDAADQPLQKARSRHHRLVPHVAAGYKECVVAAVSYTHLTLPTIYSV